VAAVAKRLVFRCAAAAQRVTPGGDAVTEAVAFEVHRADPVGSVLDDMNLGCFRTGQMLGFADGAGDRTGRAPIHRLDDVLDGCAVGVDPGFLTHAEHAGEPVGAKPGVRAKAPIVMDSEAAALVTHAPVSRAVGEPLVTESVAAVGAVAKRFVARASAAAQGNACYFAHRFTVRPGHM